MRRRGAGIALVLGIGWVIAGAAPAGPAAPHDPAPHHGLQQPVIVEAAVSKVDYQSGTAIFDDIVVSQGGTRITADRAQATGLDFESSRWTFDGHVLMSLPPRDTLRSDQAIVEIRGGEVAQATATGSPAQFEQQRTGSGPGSGTAFDGHANRIVYDAAKRTVRLSGDAWLSDGRNEITGPLLAYDLQEETITAASPGRNRAVRITAKPSSPAHHRKLALPSRAFISSNRSDPRNVQHD